MPGQTAFDQPLQVGITLSPSPLDKDRPDAYRIER